jgi:hypothetical protein
VADAPLMDAARERLDPFSPERKKDDLDNLMVGYAQSGGLARTGFASRLGLRKLIEDAYELGCDRGCEVNY